MWGRASSCNNKAFWPRPHTQATEQRQMTAQCCGGCSHWHSDVTTLDKQPLECQIGGDAVGTEVRTGQVGHEGIKKLCVTPSSSLTK